MTDINSDLLITYKHKTTVERVQICQFFHSPGHADPFSTWYKLQRPQSSTFQFLKIQHWSIFGLFVLFKSHIILSFLCNKGIKSNAYRS